MDKLTKSISEFWSALSGAVHPDDQLIFDDLPDHSFNLEYPPPAFIGNVETAPIVVLMSNGGYNSGKTQFEFPDKQSVNDYINLLRGRFRGLPQSLSRYYTAGPFGDLIKEGKCVLVNAVAYRSPKLSSPTEAYNRVLAERLPSLAVHRAWLRSELLPQARRGERLVLVHRKRWWAVPEDIDFGPNVVFSDAARAEPNRPAPDRTKIAAARSWLTNFETKLVNEVAPWSKAQERFNDRFSTWSINIPNINIAKRRNGRIRKEGWTICYCFGSDQNGEYIDYLASHRMMWGDEHVRLRRDGNQEHLPSLDPAVPFGTSDEETSRLQADRNLRNEMTTNLLKQKRFLDDDL